MKVEQSIEVEREPQESFDLFIGTVVSLEHRLFELLGPAGQPARDGFAGGWPGVLACYSTAASGGA